MNCLSPDKHIYIHTHILYLYIYTHTHIYLHTLYKNTNISYKITDVIGPVDVLLITWNNERWQQFIFSYRRRVFNKTTI